MRAAIYARVSTKDQDTLSEQLSKCRATAEAKGWTVQGENVYQDHGFTGKTMERPGWGSLERAVERREVDAAIVFQISRSARNTGRLHAFIEKCQEQDVVFTSVSEGLDSSTAMGRSMITIIGAMAELEHELLSDRVLLRMEELWEGGQWVGGDAPFGYDLDLAAEGRLRINEREAACIRRGVATMLNPGGNATRVAREWNEARVPPKPSRKRLRRVAKELKITVTDEMTVAELQAKIEQVDKTKVDEPWTNNAVKRVLVSERIAGMLDGRRMKWDPIVTVRDHQQVVDRFAENPRNGGSRSERYLLTGLARCGSCGDRKLIGRPNAGTRRYVCDGGPEGRKLHLGVNAEALEAYVLSEAARRDVPDPAAPEDPEADRELLTERDRIDSELAELAGRRYRGEVNEQYARAGLRELERQAREVEQRLAERPRGRFGKLLQYTEEYLGAYPDDRAQLDAQVERITVNPSPPGFKTKAVESRVEIQWRPEAGLL